MQSALSFTNWSLRKTLQSTNDPVKNAKIIVFYYVFVLNFFKIGAILPGYLMVHDFKNIIRCGIASMFTLLILKILLSRPDYLNKLVHFALAAAVFALWNSTFLYHNNLSLITIQNVFMVSMWSFYGLSGWWGFFYSAGAITPLFGYIFMNKSSDIAFIMSRTSMESSLFIIALNFIIILLSHYYYRNILYKTIDIKERLNAELEKSNEAKNLFFSTMSHELRNPLNAVIGISNLLIDANKGKDKEQEENLDILKFSAESLLSLINDILDLNKIGSGKVVLETIPFDLKKLLESACAGLRIRATEKDLYCINTIDAGIGDEQIIGDPTRLLQIIYNLVGNAIKFTKKGGVELNVSLLKRTEDSLSLRFTIHDTGLGISTEQQQYIFEPFTQASINTTRKYGGTGLGLSIVKHLLTLHKSSIHVESELNAGAKFYFDISYQVAKPAPGLLPVNNNKSSVSLPKLNILLAEDNLINIMFMKKLFSRWGITIDIAENGEEVIHLLNDRDYDLILMDIQMPVMNGYDTTVKIRQMENVSKSNTYIIALTGSVSKDVYTSIIAAGMNDLLSKPFRPDELYKKLENIPFAKA